jgi:hypothetical protein
MKILWTVIIVFVGSATVQAESSTATPPDHWLRDAIVVAISGVAGFFGKVLYDQFQAKRKAKRDSKSEMQKLSVLLKESGSLFRDQNYKARRLLQQLESRLGDQVPVGLGFDEAFYRLYSQLEPDERELHSLIRSTTINSLRRVNSAMDEWLRRNFDFRRSDVSHPDGKRLAEELSALELHLNQWHDKFDAHMKDEKRCLVYLDDEKKQGAGFPQDLEIVLSRALARA